MPEPDFVRLPVPEALAAHVRQGKFMLINIAEGSPADQAGLDQYDVVLSFNDRPIEELSDLLDAIREGAVLRVRPKAMTVAVIFAGLLPIMVTHGAGSEVMQRIAAPMVGGMVTAPLLSMLVIPAVYLLLRRMGLRAAPRVVTPTEA